MCSMQPWHDSKHSTFCLVIYLFSSSKNNSGLYICPASLYHQVISHPSCSVSAPTVLMVIDMGGGPLPLPFYRKLLPCPGCSEILWRGFDVTLWSRRTGLCHGSYPPLLVHFFLDCTTLRPSSLLWLHIHPFSASVPIEDPAVFQLSLLRF